MQGKIQATFSRLLAACRTHLGKLNAPAHWSISCMIPSNFYGLWDTHPQRLGMHHTAPGQYKWHTFNRRIAVHMPCAMALYAPDMFALGKWKGCTKSGTGRQQSHSADKGQERASVGEEGEATTCFQWTVDVLHSLPGCSAAHWQRCLWRA